MPEREKHSGEVVRWSRQHGGITLSHYKNCFSPLFSPGGEPKGVRGPSVQGARRSAPHFLNNAGVLEQYVEHGEQAQRSNGGPIACFGRQLVRKAG